jgi:uridine kinase
MNIVQLIGGSGSGKSELARQLVDRWPGMAVSLRTNRYLRNRTPSDGQDFVMRSDSVDWPLVRLHVEMLLEGHRVSMPDYNWHEGRRLPSRLNTTGTLELIPAQLLLIESLHFVPGLECVKIFLDTPLEKRREGVAQRDQELEGYFKEHFDSVTQPGYLMYTAPLRDQCELILDGSLEMADLTEQAQKFLGWRWGRWE